MLSEIGKSQSGGKSAAFNINIQTHSSALSPPTPSLAVAEYNCNPEGKMGGVM